MRYKDAQIIEAKRCFPWLLEDQNECKDLCKMRAADIHLILNLLHRAEMIGEERGRKVAKRVAKNKKERKVRGV